MSRTTKFIAGPIFALLLGLLAYVGSLSAAQIGVAALVGWTAAWWIFEPIPIPLTSIIPFFALPMVGAVNHKVVAQAYGHTIILLLMAGFMLSRAMEVSLLHERIAGGFFNLMGMKTAEGVLFSFMMVSWFFSMWISNTATTLMLLPIVLATLKRTPLADGARASLLLGLAYSASIGGMGTPIGTPPNLILMGHYEEAFSQEIDFISWMTKTIPISLVLLLVAWAWLQRNCRGEAVVFFPKQGPLTIRQKRILLVFLFTALGWIFRGAPFGGWTGLLELKGVGDSTVGLMGVVALGAIRDGQGGPLMTWEDMANIPWGLLLLFGGGIALAKGFEASGLSVVVGTLLAGGLSFLPIWASLLILCLGVTFLTEITSNTATTTLLMPILGAAALGAQVDPLLLMMPAALTTSCAFMLPVATAPNAVVYGTKLVSMSVMMREGVVLNFLGVGIISIFTYFIIY